MKIVTIGAGMVGRDVLNYLLHFSAAKELIVIDLDQNRAEAEVMDFQDTYPLHFYNLHKKISYGTYDDLKGADFVIINVSIKQTSPDRDALIEANSKIMKDIAQKVKASAPTAFVVITSNPLDSMTYAFLKYSGMDKHKVLGTGTLLETVRFKRALSEHYNISHENIEGYVLGEHGPTCFIPWSLLSVAGMKKEIFEELNSKPALNESEVLDKVIDRGLDIFRRRGFTDHGIASTVAKIVNAISQDEKVILPVAVYLDDYFGMKDIVLSAPVLLGKNGIEEIIQIPLTQNEIDQYQASYQHVKKLKDTFI